MGCKAQKENPEAVAARGPAASGELHAQGLRIPMAQRHYRGGTLGLFRLKACE